MIFSKYKLSFRFLILLFALLTMPPAYSQQKQLKTLQFKKPEINAGLVENSLNQNADIILVKVPEGLFLEGDEGEEKTVAWRPVEQTCELRYGTRPGNRDLDNHYPNKIQATGTGSLKLNPALEGMDVGVYYCILVATDDVTLTSVEFKIIVQAQSTAIPNAPLGNINLSQGSPTFRWAPVQGVPYYFLLLSEGPISINRDEKGEIDGLAGLNLTWQVITSESFIQYGAQDPSGTFENIYVPPLLPDIEYNWLVLNSYSADGSLASTDVAPVAPSAFQVSRAGLSQSPDLLEPVANATISSDKIDFRWQSVDDATRYRFFLYEDRRVADSEISFIISGRTTTNNFIEYDATGTLVNTNYHWRVIAENASALESSEYRTFIKESSSRPVKFTCVSQETEVPVELAAIELQNNNNVDLLTPVSATDTSGTTETDLPLGEYYFTASKSGFITERGLLSVVAGEDTLRFEITMERSSTTISGQIIDGNGDEVSNAFVDMKSSDGIETTFSDAFGSFSFSINPGSVQIRARKLGYATTDYQTFTLQNDQALDAGQIQLDKATNLVSGNVSLADDGRSLQGAVISARKENINYKTTTNNQGGYRFELGPGVWQISIEAPGLYASPPRFEINLEQNQQVQAPFQMFSGGLINGSVLFNGQSVEDIEIGAYDASNVLVQSAFSNIQGNYAMGLPAGNYMLSVSSSDYIGASKNIDVATGQTITENFELTQAGFVEGQVLNLETNAPASNVKVFAVNDTSLATVTDNEGNYRLSLPPGTLYQIDALLPGFQSNGPLNVTTVSGETITGRNFVLTALSGIIRGVVTDGNAPLPEATVKIGDEPAFLTGDDGRFEVERPPGQYQVLFSKDCHLPGQRMIELQAGIPLELELELRPLTSNISGRVVDFSGFPIRDVVISARGDTVFSSISDEQGFYEVCLNAGFYRITAQKPGYFTQDTTLVVGDGDFHAGINFRLEESFATLSGAVTDNTGAPAANAFVAVTDAAGTRRAPTDFNGIYSMEKIIPGAVTVRAIKNSYYGLKSALNLQERQNATRNLVLYPANGAISGRVFDSADSSAISGVDITATFSADRDTVFKVSTNLNGAYRFTNLPEVDSGTFQLFAFHEEYSNSAPISNVRVHSENNDFYLIRRTGMIAGKIVDQDSDKPVSGARVEATNSTGNRSLAFSDTLGKFILENLTPGSFYNLNVSSIGFFNSQSNTVATGDTTVVIELQRKYGFIEGTITSLTNDNPMGNVTVTATPLGDTGQEASAVTDASGKYRLRLIADFYNVRPVFSLYRSEPNLLQIEVSEIDTIRNIDFMLEKQDVSSIIVQRKDQTERPSISHLQTHCYEAIARDANGRPVVISAPKWRLNVSSRAARIDENGCLELDPLYFGELTITAEEQATGEKGDLTVQVFAPIDEATDATFFDDRGLQLEILSSSVATRRELFVSQSPIAAAKKGRARYFMSDFSYVIGPTGFAFDDSVRLMLPAPPNTEGQRHFVARWAPRESVWELYGSTESDGIVSARIQDAGEYVALAISKPLGIENLTLTPNPFSPYLETDGLSGLKIEFDLSSGTAPNPLLTVNVYNLEGNRVRQLYEQAPFPRGKTIINWDGRADNGALARNGRYIVRIIAFDPKDRSEKIKSVILIK